MKLNNNKYRYYNLLKVSNLPKVTEKRKLNIEINI